MSEDITYCLNKYCTKKKCERHASHIKNTNIPHSYAMFNCQAVKHGKRIDQVFFDEVDGET